MFISNILNITLNPLNLIFNDIWNLFQAHNILQHKGTSHADAF